MTSAAVAHAPRDDGGPLRPLAARVIRWRVMQSDSSKVDEAVIEIEAEGGNWRLAHIYRFSDERHGWRPSIIWDAGDEYVYFRDYHSQPSGPALESFLRASEWGDVNGFRIIAGDRR